MSSNEHLEAIRDCIRRAQYPQQIGPRKQTEERDLYYATILRHANALATELAEAEARSHDLYEGIESALNYYVCCEEYPEAECHHFLDEVTTQLHAHGDWFYDDARPWMQEPDATERPQDAR